MRLLVKRDDLTGLALGGNKARKLDYLIKDAIDEGLRHARHGRRRAVELRRMTAAAAARLGMACHLVLGGEEPAQCCGNLVLDRLFGASCTSPARDDWTVLEAEVKRIAAEIGRSAYPMPVGGATPVGALAYVHAADELLSQMMRRRTGS